MLTNLQLISLAKRARVPLAGIYTKDEIPQHLTSGHSYIFNIQDAIDDETGAPQPGTHWVAFQEFRCNDGTYLPIWFDSFGIGPVRQILDIYGKGNVLFNSRQIQDMNLSAACGWYCMAWLIFMNHSPIQYHTKEGYEQLYDHFISMFDPDNQANNDDVLRRFFQRRPDDGGVRPPSDTSIPE